MITSETTIIMLFLVIAMFIFGLIVGVGIGFKIGAEK